MLETYQGILRDSRIEWCGEAPPPLPQGKGVRVHVTLLDKVSGRPASSHQGQRMAAALECLAAADAMKGISDPAAWERETRQDRPLPGREP